jgi:hypothetical protein
LETNDDEKGDDEVKENEKRTDNKCVSELKEKSEEEDQNCKCCCYLFLKIRKHIH